jgi:hypothetical protein
MWFATAMRSVGGGNAGGAVGELALCVGEVESKRPLLDSWLDGTVPGTSTSSIALYLVPGTVCKKV